ncbi:hypothetical protein PAXRUDRAFT_551814 [Paxillus rubicundulus Ve08.2h10]|uniref:RBR-type E3 ubiquitin transferase n=1 Tax=Paxillus rubicundulus Ve08.2h10 TaxID=930991 RepID=A0A0D0E5L4_9AGAM|nr:hypothetical protein PAXRUDRAFT_551814 [Paxillus rubicundulus Ve08.2h10]
MNVAGPSRARPGRRAESTYEEDLLGIVQGLSLDELERLQTFYENRTRNGDTLSDHDVAMNVLLHQARRLSILDEDIVLAQRLAAEEGTAVNPRAPQVNAAPNRNQPAAQQNQPNAMQRPNRNPPNRNNAQQSQTWGGWFSSMFGWVASPGRARAPTATTPTNVAVPRTPAANRPTGHTCVICQEPIFGSEIRAPCGHHYDIACVTELFQASTRDETLYPPRCCRQNIPVAQVRPHLSQALVTEFEQKGEEFGTLKRVYCSSPTCSRFLGPVSEGFWSIKVYDCPAPACTRRTCGGCRAEYSGAMSHVCRADADAAQVLTLGRNAGWSRCPGCSQMIELNMGCFHMTCRCRTEFCYLCLARWKTCTCPQWDERRLLAAAEQRVDAQLEAGQGNRAQRAVPAQQVRQAPVRVPGFIPAPAAIRHVPERQAQHVPRAVVPPRPPVPVVNVPARPAAGWWQAAAVPTPAPQPRPQPRATPTPTAVRSPVSSSGQARSSVADAPKETVRQRMVRETMERLRVDHDCNHGRWRFRRGGGRCETCGHNLPHYLFRCEGCEMLACNRCRRNRL